MMWLLGHQVVNAAIEIIMKVCANTKAKQYIYRHNLKTNPLKKLAIVLLSLLAFTTSKAQTTIGPAEKKLTDSLCNALGRLDMSTIHTKEEANNAFMECFGRFASILIEVAEEHKVEMSDGEAMRLIGQGIGKNLMRENCPSFMKIAVKMAGKDTDEGAASSTAGTVKRIDNKGFNYVVITDQQGKEKSFLWLREFAGSDKFTGLPASYTGKKVTIKWQEMEVYLPQAKGYYKVKEITGVQLR